MVYIPVALELYSVHKELAENPWAVMKAVKAMGYEGVEFAGNPQYRPEFYAALLKESGLVCCGWHTGWGQVQPETIDATIELNLAVGNKYVIIPALSANSHDEWAKRAEELNAVAEKLAHYGMKTGYHCHPGDFNLLDGKRPWDTFMGVASERTVFQLDVGNAMEGGADVLAELKAHPGRCQTIHLKPWSKAKGFEPLIGDDDAPWRQIFDFCAGPGATEWFIIEYECPALPPMEAVEKCLKNTKRLLGQSC